MGRAREGHGFHDRWQALEHSRRAAGGLKGIQPDLQPWLPLILKPEPQAKPTFTKEELEDAEKRAKEYSRQKSYQNLAWRRDMEAKFRLRNEAVAALPEVLQHSANQP